MESVKKFFSVVWFYVCVCYKKYFDFKGRARRKEFWSFFLFATILGILIDIIFVLTGLDLAIRLAYADIVLSESPSNLSWFVLVLNFVFNLAIFGIPCLAVAFRRVHDVGHSYIWEILIFLIVAIAGADLPILGGIFLLVYIVLILYDVFKDSQSGENKWGANPKELEN